MTKNRKSLEPWILDSVDYYDHQVDGVRHLARYKNFLLADDMGLGKSLQAMTIFAVDVVRGWASTAIIICPVILKANWSDELDKFTRFPYLVLEGGPAARQKQLIEFSEIKGPKVLIVNYEQVRSHLDALNKMKFDIKIIDEAHYCKNYKSQRTKAVLALKTRRVFCLTGTPMLNHINELWPILHMIDEPGFGKYWNFVSRYAVFGGWKDKQIIGVKNEKELKERLHGIMLRRLKTDVLDLPEVQIIQRKVALSEEQRKLYDDVITDMRLPRPDAPDDEIENALTKFLRLKQICGTTRPFTGEDISSKLDLAIADDLEILANDRKVVEYTQFRDVQDCYQLRMKSYSVPVWILHGDVKPADRVPIIKEWAMTKEPGVLIAMLQIIKEGVNLTASRDGSFLDKLFVPGLNQQAIDRMHRIGSDLTQPVQIREYLCTNTIDTRIQQILKIKSKLFGEIVETDPNWKRKIYKALLDDLGGFE